MLIGISGGLPAVMELLASFIYRIEEINTEKRVLKVLLFFYGLHTFFAYRLASILTAFQEREWRKTKKNKK
jgi:hypothetical protein